MIRWYSYITQVARMFDKDMHKEYLFLSYLIGLLPGETEDPIDLDGKLKLEYYKLQKTFEGEIRLKMLMVSMFRRQARVLRATVRRVLWMRFWRRLMKNTRESSRILTV